MSDETTRTDDWGTADVSGAAPEAVPMGSPAAGAAAAGDGGVRPAGFCQDCGRGLTPESLRAVGTGVFCEPCLEKRLRQGPVGGYAAGTAAYGAAPGYGAVPGYGAAQAGPYTTVPPVVVAAVPGEPSPGLACCLGVIPGVGAMYNGQFAKGVVHLVIFVILVSMADNVSGIFWIFVWGWIFYQAFEAYHTAKARMEGLPLPNAFGFNDIGERMGFGKSWGAVGQPNAGQPPVTPAANGWETGATGQGAGTVGEAVPVVPVVPVSSAAAPPWTPPAARGTDWVGYVPPTEFAQADARRQAGYQAMKDAGYAAPGYSSGYAPGYAPGYAETFTGQAGTGYGVPVAPERRFPVGAVWLIVLGGLILLANVVPDWRIGGRWWPPVLLAGFAVWLFLRRMRAGARVACIVRWPAILMVLAILFALHAAYFVVTGGTMCAVLLIAFGALLLMERTLGAGPGYAGGVAYGGAYPATTPPSQDRSAGTTASAPVSPEAGRATFTTADAPVSAQPADVEDDAKGGQ